MLNLVILDKNESIMGHISPTIQLPISKGPPPPEFWIDTDLQDYTFPCLSVWVLFWVLYIVSDILSCFDPYFDSWLLIGFYHLCWALLMFCIGLWYWQYIFCTWILNNLTSSVCYILYLSPVCRGLENWIKTGQIGCLITNTCIF